MELIKLNKTLPMRSYPEKELNLVMATQFKYFIASLLSLKDESEEKIDNALPAVKKHCWSMGLKEVKKMFEMYADGELSIQPKSNHFDRVLVGQIYNAYRAYRRVKTPEKKSLDKDKELQDQLIVIGIFDMYNQRNEIPPEVVWIYDYVVHTKGLYQPTKKERNTAYNIAFERLKNNEAAIESSKLNLLGRYFGKLIAKDKHIKELLED